MTSQKKVVIDLNADVGEDPAAISDGREAALIANLTSVNIACGAHAGDEATALASIRLAQAAGCAIGAHPSYPDRVRFGRQTMNMTAASLTSAVIEQLEWLRALLNREGAQMGHVKPHGALYHDACRREDIADVLAEALLRFDRTLVVGAAGSPALGRWRARGMRVAAEGFADRVYHSDGSLRPRTELGALITDPAQAAAQAVSIACDRVVIAHDGTVVALECDTICIHSDTPNAPQIAQAVRIALEARGVTLRDRPWA